MLFYRCLPAQYFGFEACALHRQFPIKSWYKSNSYVISGIGLFMKVFNTTYIDFKEVVDFV